MFRSAERDGVKVALPPLPDPNAKPPRSPDDETIVAESAQLLDG